MVLCILAIICEFLYFSLFLSVGRKCVKAFKSHEEIRRVASLQQFKDKEMKYFNFVGAEGDNAMIVRCYITSKFNTIEPGLSFRFQNLTTRGKNEFWATSKTIISYTSTVDVSPDFALPCLPEKMPPEGLNHSLQEALNSPEKSSIMGKIVKVDMCNF